MRVNLFVMWNKKIRLINLNERRKEDADRNEMRKTSVKGEGKTRETKCFSEGVFIARLSFLYFSIHEYTILSTNKSIRIHNPLSLSSHIPLTGYEPQSSISPSPLYPSFYFPVVF
jgi:hypothetical protein